MISNSVAWNAPTGAEYGVGLYQGACGFGEASCGMFSFPWSAPRRPRRFPVKKAEAMKITLDLLFVCALGVLSLGLLMWFILRFVPSVLNLKDEDSSKF